MAFWCRIGKLRLKQFSQQFKIITYASPSKARLAQNPHLVIHSKPADFCYNARFFAVPVQYQKQKKEAKGTSGPRLNEKITAEVVRLVMGDEHTIVSRLEALARARQLNLDLVEVSGNANPPVCKIMDFNKEQYLKDAREKERAKSKAQSTLRQGNLKEVRFSGKTEQKDLQMKADNVTRLMEDGYRVKCTAKGTAEQDVLGTLSRISALIEDIAVVESGPTIGKDGAFLIVRHRKFGTPKKGGGKIKDLADASSLKATSTTAEAVEPSLETNKGNSFDEVGHASVSTSASSDSDIHGSDRVETPHDTINRYKKGGPRNMSSPNKRMDHRNASTRDSTRAEPQFSNQGRRPPRDINFSQQMRGSDEPAVGSSAFRYNRPPLNVAPGQEPFSPGVPDTPNGNFSAPAKQGVDVGVGENGEQNRYSARRPAPRGDLAANQNLPSSRYDRSQLANDSSRQGRFGIFSRD